MPFKTITTYICEDCNKEVANPDKHWCAKRKARRAEKKREDEQWERNYNRIQNSWDVWEAKQNIEHARPPCDNTPRQIAHKGKCILTYMSWGEKEYKSEVLTNPTYGTVLKHFDDAIALTGDDHHIFFEGLEARGKRNGITKLEICAGS